MLTRSRAKCRAPLHFGPRLATSFVRVNFKENNRAFSANRRPLGEPENSSRPQCQLGGGFRERGPRGKYTIHNVTACTKSFCILNERHYGATIQGNPRRPPGEGKRVFHNRFRPRRFPSESRAFYLLTIRVLVSEVFVSRANATFGGEHDGVLIFSLSRKPPIFVRGHSLGRNTKSNDIRTRGRFCKKFVRHTVIINERY